MRWCFASSSLVPGPTRSVHYTETPNNLGKEPCFNSDRPASAATWTFHPHPSKRESARLSARSAPTAPLPGSTASAPTAAENWSAGRSGQPANSSSSPPRKSEPSSPRAARHCLDRRAGRSAPPRTSVEWTASGSNVGPHNQQPCSSLFTSESLPARPRAPRFAIGRFALGALNSSVLMRTPRCHSTPLPWLATSSAWRTTTFPVLQS